MIHQESTPTEDPLQFVWDKFSEGSDSVILGMETLLKNSYRYIKRDHEKLTNEFTEKVSNDLADLQNFINDGFDDLSDYFSKTEDQILYQIKERTIENSKKSPKNIKSLANVDQNITNTIQEIDLFTRKIDRSLNRGLSNMKDQVNEISDYYINTININLQSLNKSIDHISKYFENDTNSSPNCSTSSDSKSNKNETKLVNIDPYIYEELLTQQRQILTEQVNKNKN